MVGDRDVRDEGLAAESYSNREKRQVATCHFTQACMRHMRTERISTCSYRVIYAEQDILVNIIIIFNIFSF